MKDAIKKFNPLIFLASLGAGGIAVMPFAFLQYTTQHEESLIKFSDLDIINLFSPNGLWLYFLLATMIVFTLLHFVLTFIFLPKLIHWKKSENYQEILNSPLKNSILVTPFISIIMTMNVFIGPIRFFIPTMSSNFQNLMLPAFTFWLLIWFSLIFYEIKLLKISFSKGFDINQISFGWLLHPFALGMLTVVGTGIAAMAHNQNISSSAAFLSMISGTMGIFLLIVKLIMIFKSHFSANDLPNKQFLPSFLIVIPNITLYSISLFRLGHFFEHSLHLGNMKIFYIFSIIIPFAFEFWYLLFGLALLKNYFKKHFWKKEFYISQWGLICPMVAFAVLGSFAYNLFFGNITIIFLWLIKLSIIISVVLFGIIFSRNIKCSLSHKNSLKNNLINCIE